MIRSPVIANPLSTPITPSLEPRRALAACDEKELERAARAFHRNPLRAPKSSSSIPRSSRAFPRPSAVCRVVAATLRRASRRTALPRSEPVDPAIESCARRVPKDARRVAPEPDRPEAPRHLDRSGTAPRRAPRRENRRAEARPGRDDSNRPPRGFLPYDVY